MSGDFERFAEEKTRDAVAAHVGVLVTDEDHSGGQPFVGIGNDWTREHFDGSFFLPPVPAARPAVSLVFVQSREGNTGAERPADLGGGATDAHLIYEGLSRVAADAVLAGGTTAHGRVFFSVWHPAILSLRRDLGMPRHPAQIVVSRHGHLDFDGTLLFNVPDVPVFIVAGRECRERSRVALGSRPWITIVPFEHEDLVAPFAELYEHSVRRISVVGGRSTASALVDAGLVQDLCLTTTSTSAGEPDTPFYVGSRSLSLEPIVRKHSTEDDQAARIRFDHLTLRVAATG